MKKILLLIPVIGIYISPILNLPINEIFNEGENIRQELEFRLESVFQKQSDAIFTKIKDENVEQKRFKANLQVNLIEVLESSIDQVMLEKIESILKRTEDEVSKIIKLNSTAFANFRSQSQKEGIKWPHDDYALREKMQDGGFAFRPMTILRDRMVCEFCKVNAVTYRIEEKDLGDSFKRYEISGIQETDLPQYYHKPYCKLITDGKIKIDSNTDAKLTVQQRIKHAISNSLLQCPVDTKINECLSNIIPTDLITIISSYHTPLKLQKFIDFYSLNVQLIGWVLFEDFVHNLTNCRFSPLKEHINNQIALGNWQADLLDHIS